MEIIDAPERANELFVFSTDFPHESFDARHCRRQIDELRARDDVNQVDKEAIWQPTPNVFTALLRDRRNILAESFARLERLEEPSTSREPP